MKIKLTKKKLKWVKTFKPNILKGNPLHYNISTAAKYHKKLDKAIDKMTAEVKRALEQLYKSEGITQDASIASQARILLNALNNKFTDMFNDLSTNLAETMVYSVDKNSKSNLFSSLEKITGGARIKTNIMSGDLSDTIKASLTENVNLIKSIQSKYFTDITGSVMRSVTSGQGLYDLLPFIERHKNITKRRAKLIAYDQTRKAYNSINKARMEKVGIKKFIWHHSSAGLYPRREHIEMDGKIYSFDDLPVIDKRTGERGIPGQAVNCKCFMTPVIEFDNENNI